MSVTTGPATIALFVGVAVSAGGGMHPPWQPSAYASAAVARRRRPLLVPSPIAKETRSTRLFANQRRTCPALLLEPNKRQGHALDCCSATMATPTC